MITIVLASILGQSQMGSRTIVYTADRDLKSVSIAGAFNNWNLKATPLEKSGRVWRVTVSAPVGRYPYKLVLDGKDWILDPGNPNKEDGGNTDYNSVLTIYPPNYEAPAKEGDSRVTANALFHGQTPSFITVDRNRLVLSLRLRPGDVRKVEAVIDGRSYPMETVAKDDLYEIRRAKVSLPAGKRFLYGFRLDDGAKFWYGAKGLEAGSKGASFEMATSSIPTVRVPKWAERTVMYQIFPDRFENGDRRNDPKRFQPWDAKPNYDLFKGGDAAGVTRHLDYLARLGIGGIYFTPVFESPANHRYLTQDFHKIDPGFATGAEFKRLTATLKQRGIRTILDGVFSCTGTDFFAFQDLLKNQQASRYRDWYNVHSFPVKTEGMPTYDAWGGYGGLPLINVRNREAQEYLLGVAPFWNRRATLGGWRLDSAERLSPEFCRAFRRREKAMDPEGWIVGEIWGDANPWLKGDMFDSVMGYQFRSAAVDFVAKGEIGPREFMTRLMVAYASYAPQVSRNLMNLLDSHDTPRFLTLCKGDRDLLVLGAALQLTWPGTPCVYYGTELGMEGGADPDNRRGMRWDLAKDDNPVLQAYRRLIGERNKNVILQSGEPVPLLTDDSKGLVAYARQLDGRAVIVVANRSSFPQSVRLPNVGDAKRLRDVLTGETIRPQHRMLGLRLGPKRAFVLVPV